jgi:hypothetical protein
MRLLTVNLGSDSERSEAPATCLFTQQRVHTMNHFGLAAFALAKYPGVSSVLHTSLKVTAACTRYVATQPDHRPCNRPATADSAVNAALTVLANVLHAARLSKGNTCVCVPCHKPDAGSSPLSSSAAAESFG